MTIHDGGLLLRRDGQRESCIAGELRTFSLGQALKSRESQVQQYISTLTLALTLTKDIQEGPSHKLLSWFCFIDSKLLDYRFWTA